MDILVYFFELRPGSAFSYYTALIVLSVAGIIGSVTISYFLKKHSENRALKKLFSKFPGRLKWLSIVMLFLLASRYENIPYFSQRVWLYATLLGIVYLIGKGTYLLIRKYPEERAFYHRNKVQKVNTEEKKTYSASKKKRK